MAKWLKVDCSTGDSFVRKSLSHVVGNHVTVDLDVFLPSATVTAILNGFASAFTADWFELSAVSAGLGGVFAKLTNAPAVLQWNDWTPNAANGTIPTDVLFHVTYDMVFVSGTSWDVTVSIDGTTVDTFTRNFTTPTNTFTHLDVGGEFASHDAGEIYYVDNIVLTVDGSPIFSDDFEDGTTGAWDSTTGDAEVVDTGGGGGPPVPTNDSCANAQELIGCSGNVTGDNRAWAGTWPTGADPLFNAIGEGGGAPLWYKWTNMKDHLLLFRVTVTDPGAHAVDYNLGLNIAADCASVAFPDSMATVDIGFGPGDVFGMNAEGATQSGYAAADDFGPSITTHFDIIVAPGQTVWLEIDSWTGDTSEPPTADAAHRGWFQFAWAALEFTTRDTMQADGSGSPDDTVLVDPVDSIGFITPLELVRIGDRLFFLYSVTDTDGDSYWAGDCALDGTDFHSFRFIDRHTTSSTPVPVNPKLLWDGTDVFVGYGYRGANTVPNPDYLDSCDNHVGETWFCFDCTDALGHWRYDLLKFDSSSHNWDAFFSIGENAPDPAWAASLPDYGDISGLDTSYFRCQSSMAPEDPGVVWIVTCYQRVRKNQSLHFNDYPITETPPGALYCTDDRVYMDEVVDVWRIDTAAVDGLGGGWTLVSRDELFIFELQHWDHDDPHINPSFGTWQHWDQGNFYTDPSGTTYLSILRDKLAMISDEGYPILAYNPILTEDNTAPALTPGDDIIIERLDTAAVIQDWDVGDISLGVETPANAPTGISLTPRYYNPETAAYERGLSTTWHSATFESVPSTPVGWLVRVPSDFSGVPTYINPSLAASSGAAGAGLPLVSSLYKDSKLGQFITSWLGEIQVYEYCSPAWERTFWGPVTQIFIAPVFYWDPVNEDAYYLGNPNRIGKTHMLRDFWICQEGSPCVAMGQPIVYVKFRAAAGYQADPHQTPTVEVHASFRAAAAEAEPSAGAHVHPHVRFRASRLPGGGVP